MFIVNYRWAFFWLTGFILVAAIAAIGWYGLPLSIDFSGGSLIEVEYLSAQTGDGARPDITMLRERVSAIPLGEVSLREIGEQGVIVRTRTLSAEEHDAVIAALSPSGAELHELRFSSVGPSLGNELSRKALVALFAVVLAIVLYIAWAFRKVSHPVPSWGYGLTVVAMLAIDIIVPTGFYAAYAHFTGAEVDALFVVALLALLGYCVNDVIVIFDRVREHLSRNDKTGVNEPFEETVGTSITETMGRSINTSLTVVLALFALIFFGPEATQNFAIVMMIGVLAGTFSSICRSAPLLIPLARWFRKA